MLKELLTTPTAKLGKASRFMVFQIKLWSHCARLLKKNRSGQQAAALSYHTLFGIVPLAIIILYGFQILPAYSGIGEKFKGFVYNELRLDDIQYPDPENASRVIVLTDQIDELVASFFSGLSEGRIAIVSFVIVIWAALGLLSTIERSFNNIWHVTRGRNFLQRMINYWALLTLGPLLLGLGIYIATKYYTFGKLQENASSSIGPTILSYLISTVAFFLLYFVLPNTKVKAKAAIWGAAVASLVWAIAKWGFLEYVTRFIPYRQVYGTMGLIPLGVFWIYLSWIIVLFGLQLTFTTQHLKSLDAADISSARKSEEYFIANEFTVINLAREIATAFEQSKAPIESEVIYSKFDLPAEFGDKILNRMVAAGIIARVAEPKTGFIPAKDPANIKLTEISDIVADAGFGQSPQFEQDPLTNINLSKKEIFECYSLMQILQTHQQSSPPEEPHAE